MRFPHVSPKARAARDEPITPVTRRRAYAAVAAVVGTLAIAACGSSSSSSNSAGSNSYGTKLFGTLPAAGTPTKGGTITEAQLSGSVPTFIFPVLDDTHISAYNVNLTEQLWTPLFYGSDGAQPKVNYALSLASGPPVPSNGGKTFTLHLKPGYKWSNGAPVDANDIIFYIDMLKAAVNNNPANWAQLTPGQFPQDVVSTSSPNATTVVINLNKAYNTNYFLLNQLQDTNDGLVPFPSTVWNVASANGPHLDYTKPANALKIFNYLYKQGSTVSTFATSPLWKDVDGPFELKDFNVSNGAYDLVPNPSFGGTLKPKFADLSVVTYTSQAAELNAVKGGTLDVVLQVDPSTIPQKAALARQGVSLFGGPSWGFAPGYYNFADPTNHFGAVIKQRYVREALAHLLDQPAIIKGIDKGAAVPQYGPVPSAPTSPYTPSDAVNPVYPYNPAAAVALLKSHGWKVVPNGTTTCVKPGTGANECGAGIPAGTPIGGNYATTPPSITAAADLADEAYISAAKTYAGINFAIKYVSFNQVLNYNNASPAGAPYRSQWAINGGEQEDIDYYPTMEGTFSTGGSFNTGGFSDPAADKLMNASVFSQKASAVETEASYLGKNPPALFYPDGDQLALVSKRVGGPTSSFLILTQVETAPQQWYVKK